MGKPCVSGLWLVLVILTGLNCSAYLAAQACGPLPPAPPPATVVTADEVAYTIATPGVAGAQVHPAGSPHTL